MYFIITHADCQNAYFNHFHTGYETILGAVSITENNKMHQQLMFDLNPFQNTSSTLSASQYLFCQKTSSIIVQPIELVILFSLFQILFNLNVIPVVICIYLNKYAWDLIIIIIILNFHEYISHQELWGNYLNLIGD